MARERDARSQLAAPQRRVDVGPRARPAVGDARHRIESGDISHGDEVPDATREGGGREREARSAPGERNVGPGVPRGLEPRVADPVGPHPSKSEEALARLRHACRVSDTERELQTSPGTPADPELRRRQDVRPGGFARPEVGVRKIRPGLLRIGRAPREVEASTGFEKDAVAQDPRVVREAARDVDGNARQRRLRRVLHSGELGARVPEAMIELDSRERSPDARRGLPSPRLRARHRTHGPATGRSCRRDPPGVGHPVLDPGQVELRRREGDGLSRPAVLELHTGPVGVVVVRVHLQVGIEDPVRLLPRVGGIDARLERGRIPHPPPPRTDAKRPDVPRRGQVVRPFGEQEAVPVPVDVGLAPREAPEKRDSGSCPRTPLPPDSRSRRSRATATARGGARARDPVSRR